MRRLRWALARLFAPVPIIADPGSDGVFVLIRGGDYTTTLAASRFRMKSTNRLREWNLGDDPEYRPSRSFVRFVGTLTILIAFLVVGCSTAAHEPIQGQDPDTAGVGSAPETVEPLSGIELAASSDDAGWASWFNSYGPGLYGAVPSYRWGDPRYSVEVCRQDDKDRCVTVVVRDFCACGPRHGEPTVIDLSRDAFSRLEDPSRGLVHVTVSTLGPPPKVATPVRAMTLPPTDSEVKP